MDEVLLYIYSNVAGPSRLFSDLHHGWMLLPALFSLEQTHSLHPPLGKSRFQGACSFWHSSMTLLAPCHLLAPSTSVQGLCVTMWTPTLCYCKRWIREEGAEIGSNRSSGCFTKVFPTTNSSFVDFLWAENWVVFRLSDISQA